MSASIIPAHRRPWLLLSPALIFITVLVVIPMAFILVYSFYENIDLAVDRPAFQFGNWQELFTDSYYHTAIWKTLRLSLIVTVLAAVLGYIPAYVIAMTRRPKPMRSGSPGCEPTATSFSFARSTVFIIVTGSPA